MTLKQTRSPSLLACGNGRLIAYVSDPDGNADMNLAYGSDRSVSAIYRQPEFTAVACLRSQRGFTIYYGVRRMFNSHIRIKRGGKKFRCQTERLFFIKHYGWFVYTRADLEIHTGLELHNGIRGPFYTQNHAKTYLNYIIRQEDT